MIVIWSSFSVPLKPPFTESVFCFSAESPPHGRSSTCGGPTVSASPTPPYPGPPSRRSPRIPYARIFRPACSPRSRTPCPRGRSTGRRGIPWAQTRFSGRGDPYDGSTPTVLHQVRFSALQFETGWPVPG
ncbi:hypothetical protein LY76DRAFT_15492 [Colletotrichum caudatum]|nr:hypothetical protein LY76DRAFT_15492 [Colletotrichum caudatum]